MTRIPILDRDETARLRQRTATTAVAIADRIESRCHDLERLCRERGRGAVAYPLLFSYVLDGMVWDRFSTLGLMSTEEATPFWAGEIWSVTPARGWSPGTNTIWHGKYVLHVIWTEESASAMGPFMADDEGLRRLLACCAGANRQPEQGVRKLFADYGVFDAEGRCIIPVFTENQDDPLYWTCGDIADEVAGAVVANLDQQALAEDFDFRDESQALVVSYHELIWDLVTVIESRGVMQRPILFASPAAARPSDVGDVVFVVRKTG